MRFFRLALAAGALLLLLTGCGGGMRAVSPTRTSGSATFTITWPASTRLIPAASASIVVEISNAGAVIARQTLPRPPSGGAGAANFSLLPVGSLTATATAYPQADGTGTAQARATVPLVIRANQTTNFSLTMGSTIDHLEVTPTRPLVIVGSSQQMGVTAKDAAGSIVLISPSKLQWSSSITASATIDANGLATGVQSGNSTLTVSELETGLSQSTIITVVAAQDTFFTIPLPAAQLNVHLQDAASAFVGQDPDSFSGGISYHATGTITLGGVPFSIPDAGLNGWNSQKAAGPNPRSITIPVNLSGITEIDTLITTYYGQPGPALATIEFFGTNGACYEKDLIGGVDVRDYNNDGFTNTINGTTTTQVLTWQDFGNGQRLDKQQYRLPSSFNNQTLTSIRLSDVGGGTLVQRLVLVGVTAVTRANP